MAMGRLLRHRIAPLLHCWDMAISLFPMLLKNFISWKPAWQGRAFGGGRGERDAADRKEYSSYGPDRKTLTSETYTFSGSAQSGDLPYSWTVTLTYDYDEANSTGNLANTVKKVAVSIMRE